MVGTQALHKMISAATPEEAYKTVTDAGIGVDVNYQDFESALTQELVSTYERLEKAAPLLRGSRYTVLEIAARCGFSNASYFTRAFTRQYGVSPTAYRQGGDKTDD